MLNQEIRDYINRSVLCWLATSSNDNFPNVSPKEAFLAYDDDSIIIANIASPQSVRNIRENEKVCVSFIDVFVQKGYQLKGSAQIITKEHAGFDAMKNTLETLTKGKFPFSSITRVQVEKAKKIIAPSYILFPETTEEQQIAESKRSYQV